MKSPVIVIPMAGASSRFFNAGYALPKYMLPLGNETLFDKAIKSFEKYFTTGTFIFVIRLDDSNSYKFVDEHTKKLGILDCRIFSLDNITKGQAETVLAGLETLSIDELNRPLYIFNIDTIRKNLVIPENDYDAYFDVFYDNDPDESKWSFCELDDTSTYIIRTAEKKKISNLCSTGLYIFRTCNLFSFVYFSALREDKTYNYYIAPIYNYLLNKEKVLPLYCLPEDVEFSGVPDEYEKLKIKYKDEEKMN